MPAAALYMVVGSALFVTVNALLKLVTREATPMQAVLYRSVFSTLPLAMLMMRQRIGVGSTRWKLLAFRGVVGFLALSLFIWSIAHLPIANVLALQQTSPIMVAIVSVLALGERPRPLHIALVALCMAGALLIVRPTRGIADLPAAMPLLSAFLSALAYTSIRALTRTEPTLRIVAWFVGVSSILAIPFALAGWRWLSWSANALLLGSGALAAVSQMLMTAAYRRAPAHIASAFSYVSVPLAYLVGVVFWAERPDAIATVGIVLVLVGGIAVVVSAQSSAASPPQH